MYKRIALFCTMAERTKHIHAERSFRSLAERPVLRRRGWGGGTETIPGIGLLFTHKNCDFGAISVKERSCGAPLSIEERHISNRFCATLWYNVNRYSDRGGSG